MIVRQQPLHFIYTDWYKAEESFVEENIYHQVHALPEKKNDADICLVVERLYLNDYRYQF